MSFLKPIPNLRVVMEHAGINATVTRAMASLYQVHIELVKRFKIYWYRYVQCCKNMRYFQALMESTTDDDSDEDHFTDYFTAMYRRLDLAPRLRNARLQIIDMWYTLFLRSFTTEELGDLDFEDQMFQYEFDVDEAPSWDLSELCDPEEHEKDTELMWFLSQYGHLVRDYFPPITDDDESYVFKQFLHVINISHTSL